MAVCKFPPTHTLISGSVHRFQLLEKAWASETLSSTLPQPYLSPTDVTESLRSQLWSDSVSILDVDITDAEDAFRKLVADDAGWISGGYSRS